MGFTDEFLQQVLNDRGKDILIYLIKMLNNFFNAFFFGGGCYKKIIHQINYKEDVDIFEFSKKTSPCIYLSLNKE